MSQKWLSCGICVLIGAVYSYLYAQYTRITTISRPMRWICDAIFHIAYTSFAWWIRCVQLLLTIHNPALREWCAMHGLFQWLTGIPPFFCFASYLWYFIRRNLAAQEVIFVWPDFLHSYTVRVFYKPMLASIVYFRAFFCVLICL